MAQSIHTKRPSSYFCYSVVGSISGPIPNSVSVHRLLLFLIYLKWTVSFCMRVHFINKKFIIWGEKMGRLLECSSKNRPKTAGASVQILSNPSIFTSVSFIPTSNLGTKNLRTVAALRFPRCVSILVAHHVMRDQFRYMLKIGKIES